MGWKAHLTLEPKMILPLFILAYTSPEVALLAEDLAKLIGLGLAVFGLYAAFEARQKRVLRWLVTDAVRGETEPIKKQLDEASQRVAWIEGALGVDDKRH